MFYWREEEDLESRKTNSFLRKEKENMLMQVTTKGRIRSRHHASASSPSLDCNGQAILEMHSNAKKTANTTGELDKVTSCHQKEDCRPEHVWQPGAALAHC